MLLVAAKMGVGKDVIWWKKILQNLVELVSMEEELIPFLCTPDIFLKTNQQMSKGCLRKNYLT